MAHTQQMMQHQAAVAFQQRLAQEAQQMATAAPFTQPPPPPATEPPHAEKEDDKPESPPAALGPRQRDPPGHRGPNFEKNAKKRMNPCHQKKEGQRFGELVDRVKEQGERLEAGKPINVSTEWVRGLTVQLPSGNAEEAHERKGGFKTLTASNSP